jgi:hypothetical protein
VPETLCPILQLFLLAWQNNLKAENLVFLDGFLLAEVPAVSVNQLQRGTQR